MSLVFKRKVKGYPPVDYKYGLVRFKCTQREKGIGLASLVNYFCGRKGFINYPSDDKTGKMAQEMSGKGDENLVSIKGVSEELCFSFVSLQQQII